MEQVATSCSRASSWPRDWTCVFCTGRWILYHWAMREARGEWIITHTFKLIIGQRETSEGFQTKKSCETSCMLKQGLLWGGWSGMSWKNREESKHESRQTDFGSITFLFFFFNVLLKFPYQSSKFNVSKVSFLLLVEILVEKPLRPLLLILGYTEIYL